MKKSKIKKPKNWIAGALSGGKNKGALRRTAMRKGLLRNDEENLSMTDLNKLEKVGGKTGKRAVLAKTFRKFYTGGSVIGVGDKVKVIVGANKGVEGHVHSVAKDFTGVTVKTDNGHTLHGFSPSDLKKYSENKMANGGKVGLVNIKSVGYNDVVDVYNRMQLPKDIFLKGKRYSGDVYVIDGYNGYESTDSDGLFGVFEQVGKGQNVWNGFKGYLQDENGLFLRAKSRRGLKLDVGFANGGGVDVNTEVILTENRPDGAKWRGVVKPFMLKSIEKNQYSGGFKRYDIDIYDDEVQREPSKEEIKQVNDFFEKVGGRYAKGGLINSSDLVVGDTYKYLHEKNTTVKFKEKTDSGTYIFTDTKDGAWISVSEDELASSVAEIKQGGNKMKKSPLMRLKALIVNGEIPSNTLQSILGRKPNYPTQEVGGLVFEKCFLRNYYRLIN